MLGVEPDDAELAMTGRSAEAVSCVGKRGTYVDGAPAVVGAAPTETVVVASLKKYDMREGVVSETSELGSTLAIVVAWFCRKLDRLAVGSGAKMTDEAVASAG